MFTNIQVQVYQRISIRARNRRSLGVLNYCQKSAFIYWSFTIYPQCNAASLQSRTVGYFCWFDKLQEVTERWKSEEPQMFSMIWRLSLFLQKTIRLISQPTERHNKSVQIEIRDVRQSKAYYCLQLDWPQKVFWPINHIVKVNHIS